MGSTLSVSHHTACFKTLIQLLENLQIPAGVVQKEKGTILPAKGLEGMSQPLLRDELEQRGKS